MNIIARLISAWKLFVKRHIVDNYPHDPDTF